MLCSLKILLRQIIYYEYKAIYTSKIIISFCMFIITIIFCLILYIYYSIWFYFWLYKYYLIPITSITIILLLYATINCIYILLNWIIYKTYIKFYSLMVKQ